MFQNIVTLCVNNHQYYLSKSAGSSHGTCVLDLPSLVFPTSIWSEGHMHLVTSCVNGIGCYGSTEGSILLSSCGNLENKKQHIRNRDVDLLNSTLIYAKTKLNLQDATWWNNLLPKVDTSVANCPHKHEQEYIAFYPSRVYVLCVSVYVVLCCLMTNLQHIIWTGSLWVSLYVKGFQEVYDYSVALWQTDGVVTLTHWWVRIWVPWTGENPR